MPHTIALVIIMEKDENVLKEIEKRVKLSLYLMNAKVATIINGSSQNIMAVIKELVAMDPSEILDILCIIYAPIGEGEDNRRFATADGILDVYHDILKPLFCEEEFNNKLKLLFTNGNGTKINLSHEDNPENKLVCNGENIIIVVSVLPNFICHTLSHLASNRGNLKKALEGYLKTENAAGPYITSSVSVDSTIVRIADTKEVFQEFNVL